MYEDLVNELNQINKDLKDKKKKSILQFLASEENQLIENEKVNKQIENAGFKAIDYKTLAKRKAKK